jgi:putative DNA primase/helicase
MAGGDWPIVAETAAIELSGGIDEGSIRTLLLRDLQTIFGAHQNVKNLASVHICEELKQMEDRPWRSYQRGQEINQNQLAYLLRDFRVESKNVRIRQANKDGTEQETTRRRFSVSKNRPPSPR